MKVTHIVLGGAPSQGLLIFTSAVGRSSVPGRGHGARLLQHHSDVAEASYIRGHKNILLKMRLGAPGSDALAHQCPSCDTMKALISWSS